MKTKIIKKIRWEATIGIVLFVLVLAYFIYSTVGISFGPIKQKENGNYCRGFDYGFKICWGDINAE